ncbi:unnamed protein product [Mycena citricolor]|uniref:Zn(2)-C6 fungal-type domain-containing protein n=1 Tax=Mycena citricolor TaxID=2018698 RepID=A0AAD2K4Z1_9AGAR|nr:unnamed protein product [Mycena citricolor]
MVNASEDVLFPFGQSSILDSEPDVDPNVDPNWLVDCECNGVTKSDWHGRRRAMGHVLDTAWTVLRSGTTAGLDVPIRCFLLCTSPPRSASRPKSCLSLFAPTQRFFDSYSTSKIFADPLYRNILHSYKAPHLFSSSPQLALLMAPRAVSSATPAPSLRNTGTRSVSAPYRRPVGQPKSSRQQYSACGACRMRRVRCDLKDLPVATGPHPACSNCQERGLKCVDEFADVKAVKLLRRGRRLQQVEAIYGKGAPDESSPGSVPIAARMPSIIPQLKPEFFSSPFWSWFSLQRPILDPTEFPARFLAHSKGSHPLGNEGKILLHVLVAWAASFGIDERGLPYNDASSRPTSARPEDIRTDLGQRTMVAERTRAERKSRTVGMVQEILALIDTHGIMRRPTWDGVRILLLILPLMEDISISPLDRRCMYEATLNQAAACVSSGGPSLSMHCFPHASDDTLTRARILWYAHMHEGLTTGMRGGRFILTEDDIDSFQSSIAPHSLGFHSNSPIPSPLAASFPPSPDLPVPHRLIHPQSAHPQLVGALHSYMSTADTFSIPLHLSLVCRRVYAVLTGSRAARRAQEGGGIDAEGMRNVWDGLEQCWEDLDMLRHRSDLSEDCHMFVGAWQMYIFECHNIIRETLKQYSMQSTVADPTSPVFSGSPRSHGATFLPAPQLHVIASRKCLRLLPSVLGIMRSFLGRPECSIFAWDAGLVRDGCFFAGFLCACLENDAAEFAVENRELNHADMEGVRNALDADEGIRLCLAVLKEMGWAFSKSEEREDTVRRIWDDKKKRKLEQQHAVQHSLPPYELEYHSPPTTYHEGSFSPFPPKWVGEVATMPLLLGERPILPPLVLMQHDSPPRQLIDSAPSTGYSVDGTGASGWPTYTPPGTANSGTSTSTGVSSGGSPVFPNLGGPDIMAFKTESETNNPFFHVTRDLDHLSFNAPTVVVRDPTECPPPHYSPSGFINSVNSVYQEHDDMDHSAAAFTTENCAGEFYH